MLLQEVCFPQAAYGPTEIQKTKMLNGIKIVAARVSGALMTACTIMFQAGSRYETNDDLGATHFIRAMSSGSGSNSTAFAKLRVLQQQGAYLTCTSDRQTIAFTLRCPTPLFTTLKGYLMDAAARCSYHEWEIDDRRRLITGDLTRMPAEQRVLDLVQNACWAGPLANSMFCEKERIDSITSDTLMNYAALNFKSIHCAVASVGIPFEETIELAEMIDSRVVRATSEQCHPQPCFRSGIETHDLGPGSDTWIAVAVRGCGTNNVKHAIVASACGTGNMTQGQHSLDRTPQGPIGMLSQGDLFADYGAFNISYADTGIFELSLALHDEDSVKASQGLALQALNCTSIDTADKSIAMVDAIPNEDVAAAAETLAANRLSFSLKSYTDVPSTIFAE
ncbi:jg8302 [Pararge aegeria aegeria]|uniref:Jg8302 protein n=1 Tax=Pararge aegeria aegeria TaxID=348720 RepID=A0A8S4SRS2_9NEOP|nr:jg8302 [Pararge aegeria aegeria]